MHTFSLYLLRHLKHESMIFRIKKCIRLRLGPDHGESHFFKGYFAKLASSWKILRILRVKRHLGEVLWFSGRAVRDGAITNSFFGCLGEGAISIRGWLLCLSLRSLDPMLLLS